MSGIFLTSAEAVERADRKCLQVHSPSAFGGWQVQRGGRRGDGIISRDSYQRFNFPRVATYIRCMRAALIPCFAFGELSLVSIAQSRFMELDVVGAGIKYAEVHSEGIVAISPIQSYYLIWNGSNSGKKSNLESLIVKLWNDDVSKVGLCKK